MYNWKRTKDAIASVGIAFVFTIVGITLTFLAPAWFCFFLVWFLFYAVPKICSYIYNTFLDVVDYVFDYFVLGQWDFYPFEGFYSKKNSNYSKKSPKKKKPAKKPKEMETPQKNIKEIETPKESIEEFDFNELIKNQNKDNVDFRIQEILKAIDQTSDFAKCLNDIGAIYHTRKQDCISASIVKQYVDNILGGYLEKNWRWDLRYKCIVYCILNNVLARNEWQDDRRAKLGIDFLANEFTELAFDFEVSQSDLWEKKGIPETVRVLITLLEFRVINRNTAKDMLKEYYNTIYRKNDNSLMKFIFSTKILNSTMGEDLDLISDEVIMLHPDKARNYLKNGSFAHSGFIGIFRKVREKAPLASAIEIKESLKRCLEKKKSVFLQDSAKFGYVGWTEVGISKGFRERYGEGPFEILKREISNGKVNSYTICTSLGCATFSFEYVQPIKIQSSQLTA